MISRSPLSLSFALVALFAFSGCAELQQLRDENSQLRQNNAGLERRASVAEADAVAKAQALLEVEQSYQQVLEKRVAENNKNMEEAARRENDLSEMVSAAEAKSRELDDRVKQLARERDESQSKLAAASASLAEEKRAGAELDRQRQELQARVDKLGADLTAAQQEAQKQKDELAKTKSDLELARAQLTEAQRHAASLASAGTATPPATTPVVTTPSGDAPAGAAATDAASSAAAEALLAAISPAVDGALKPIGGTAKMVGGTVVIAVPSSAIFETGVVDLNETGRSALRAIAAAVAAQSLEGIAVAGHTDNQPIDRLPFYNNTELSFRRAFAIALFLGEEAGLPDDLLHVEAWGEHRPAESNKNAQGRAANRRVELILKPKP